MRRLREIAEAAYYPDHPWRERMDDWAGIEMYSECEKHEGCGPVLEEVNIETGDLRGFVMTFDPPTVLALLDVAEAADVATGVEMVDGIAYCRLCNYADDLCECDLGALADALARLREVTR